MKWLPEHDATLIRFAKAGRTREAASEAVHRTPEACSQRLQQLRKAGLTDAKFKHSRRMRYTPRERYDSLLIEGDGREKERAALSDSFVSALRRMEKPPATLALPPTRTLRVTTPPPPHSCVGSPALSATED